MDDICVLIRVYNRTLDLKYCVDLIRDTWKSHNYHILVVSNGKQNGYPIDQQIIRNIDCLVEIANNIGHFKGNSQLLLEGLPYIPDTCKYTIILEADTWLYGDDLVKKYIHRLNIEDAVWASAQFFSYVRNLATDFAIVNTSFAKTHPEVFTFSGTPEYYVANYLSDTAQRFIYIKELMPVNTPKYITRYPFAPGGRFFVFPDGKMVTHHIENLKGGINEKMFHFNVVAGKSYFKLDRKFYKVTRFAMKVFIKLSYLFPYKSWFVNTKPSNPY
jgi:hypothetical protein